MLEVLDARRGAAAQTGLAGVCPAPPRHFRAMRSVQRRDPRPARAVRVSFPDRSIDLNVLVFLLGQPVVCAPPLGHRPHISPAGRPRLAVRPATTTTMPRRGYTGFTYGAEGAAVPHEPATIPPERLWAEYIARRRPVIIDGLPADGFHAARWTHLPYLAALAGDVPVRVEPRHPSGQFGTAIPRRTMRFGDFVESLGPGADPAQRGTVYLTTQYDAPPDLEPDASDGGEEQDDRDGQEDTSKSACLGKRRRSSSSDRSSPAPSTVSLTPSESEMDPLLPAPCNALVSDFTPQPSLMGNLLLQQVNLWLGSSPDPDGVTENSVMTEGKVGQTSGLHHDFHDNLYVLLRGEKRFLLFPPDAHPFLHMRGDVARVHHNGLIVYDQEDEESEEESADGLVQGPAPPAAELIRADGLPESQAEKWRVRARVRKVQEMEDALALSRGGEEAQRARHKRKGKARMSAQLAEALEQVADAQKGYELAKLYELGVRPVEASDLGSDSDLSSSEFESSEDEPDEEEEGEERPVQREKGTSFLASRQGAESDTSMDQNELAMLLDDATTPLPPHLVAYLKQQQSNGDGGIGSNDEGDNESQDQDDSQDHDEGDDDRDDDDSGDNDDSGVEEDELAALLAEATEPVRCSPPDAVSSSEGSGESNGGLTRVQLEQLKTRYGAAESVSELEELKDASAGSEELQLSTPMLREAVALANPEGPLVDVDEEDLRSLVYDIPRAWAAAGAPILDPPMAAHLRDVWELLDKTRDSDEGPAVMEVDDDVGDDDDDDEEGLPFFDDAGSTASLDYRNAEDGEAYLAGLAEGAAPPEPPSFSRIKPQDLWEHFGLSAAQEKKGKKSKKSTKSKNKFDPQVEAPLPGCPPPMIAQLKPGQMLYLPTSWFHEVTSFASAPGDVHMALNYWFHPPTNTVGAPAYRKKKRSAAGSAQAVEEIAGLPPPLAFDAPYLDTEVAREVRAAIQAKLARAQKQGEQYASAVAGTTVAQQAHKVAETLVARSRAAAHGVPETESEGETVEVDLSRLPSEKMAALMSVLGTESSEEEESKNGRSRGKGRNKGRYLTRVSSSEADDPPAKKQHKKKKESKQVHHDKPGKLDQRPNKRRRT